MQRTASKKAIVQWQSDMSTKNTEISQEEEVLKSLASLENGIQKAMQDELN